MKIISALLRIPIRIIIGIFYRYEMMRSMADGSFIQNVPPPSFPPA